MKNMYKSTLGGRQLAFEETISEHVPALHRAARRILPSEDLAWDAVQETLVRAWSYPELPEQPLPLLLSLIRRSCLHILRCSRRRSDHEFIAAAERTSRCCPMDPEGAAADPAATAAERDEIRHMSAMASRLTREHREVLELVAWRGLSYDEAATRLQLPIGTVRSRTSRARAALSQILTDHASETPAC
ncbi:RNA polymerase sigma factor [Planctomycetota bacterium]|jgi:RNA polymerase sigma-70 factor (ECF subfamily)|nr:RNA polymerase sigma factor [bacterium]MDB4736388.1 RNA polymerase sigma factor [Planctomycetota bacterium]